MANSFRGILCLLATLAVLAFAMIVDVHAQAASPPAAVPGGDGPATTEPTGPAYTFAFQLSPERPLYYTIETTIRDSGGVPPLLSYATTVEDRKSIVQKVTPDAEAAAADGVQVTWECDRYEVREKGMKEDAGFDSLRDLYPVPTLYGLGGIPGSQTIFTLDPRTGKASNFRIQLAPVKGAGGGRLSKTAGKCRLDRENLSELLEQLGPLYVPSVPKQVGERWTRTLREAHQNLGIVVTELTCTLQSVRDVDGRKIATIDLNGEVRLADGKDEQAAPTEATSAPASQPAARAGAQPVIRPADESIAPPADEASAPPGRRPAAQTTGLPATQPTHEPVARPDHQTAAEHASESPDGNGGEPAAQPEPAARPGHQTEARPAPVSSSPAGCQPTTTQPASQPSTQPASQPSTQLASQPSTQPARPSRRPAKSASKQREYKLDRKEYVGSVEFDLTRGELVRMNLRQQVEFVAELDKKESNPLASQIRSGTLRELRVQVADAPPAKPVIIGGPKPPAVPAPEADRPKPVQRKPPAPASRRNPPAAGRRSVSPGQSSNGVMPGPAAASQAAARTAQPVPTTRRAIDRRSPRRQPAKVVASQPAQPDARKTQLAD